MCSLYPADVMKNVNKVQYEELSQEQIAAARKRRSQELCALLPAFHLGPDEHMLSGVHI